MEVIMEILRLGKRLAVIPVLFAGALLLLFVPFGTAGNSSSAVSLDEPLFIQGVVRRVLPEKNMIIIKITQGEKISVRVDHKTGFVGIVSLDELEKGQRLKVWYKIIGEKKKAVKVEKLPELGC